MAQCVYCKAETELYFAHTPVCVKCGDQRSSEQRRSNLIHNIAEATLRADAASEAFQKVMGEIPSEVPHPDSVQRIKNVSQRLSKAHDEMMEAHRQLDDYIRGSGDRD